MVTKVVSKVMMFIYREHDGEKQFYLLDRPHNPGKDKVVPTGHIGDTIPDESPVDAATRELKEELGAEPISIQALDYQTETLLEQGTTRSTEHGFLIEVEDKEFPFLEYDDVSSSWHTLDDLEQLLTYDSQSSAIIEIKSVLGIK